MTFSFDGYNYTVRLNKGELVAENLLKLVREKDIKGGWLVGLGGLTWAELGFYDLESRSYEWTKLDEPLELTNLTGNIAWENGEPKLHLHANVSDTSLHVRGGHLKEAETNGTVEIFIHRWQKDEGLNRDKDEQTGLSLLSL